VLWSGLGKNGAARAQAWVAENGGPALEMTPGGQWLNSLDLFGPNSPVTGAEATQIWNQASRSVVSQASGQVRAIFGNAYRPGIWQGTSTFGSIEMPALMNNAAVTGLDQLCLLPKIGIK
jgi:hypothetical protein